MRLVEIDRSREIGKIEEGKENKKKSRKTCKIRREAERRETDRDKLIWREEGLKERENYREWRSKKNERTKEGERR